MKIGKFSFILCSFTLGALGCADAVVKDIDGYLVVSQSKQIGDGVYKYRLTTGKVSDVNFISDQKYHLGQELVLVPKEDKKSEESQDEQTE